MPHGKMWQCGVEMWCGQEAVKWYGMEEMTRFRKKEKMNDSCFGMFAESDDDDGVFQI